MSTGFKRELVLELPTPLAQLYQAANNARQAGIRAQRAWLLFEAVIRLGTASQTACYRSEVSIGQASNDGVDNLLGRFSSPQLGDWFTLLNALARHFGTRPDTATHPLGNLNDQLNQIRTDLPGLYALHKAIEEDAGEQPIDEASFTVRRVLDSVVEHQQSAAEDDDEGTIEDSVTDEILLPAVNEILQPEVFAPLGPPGTRLIWIEGIETVDADNVSLQGQDLIGTNGERLDPVAVKSEHVGRIAPERVALCWPERERPVCLDPLVHFREGDLNVECLFLGRDVNGKSVEMTVSLNGEKIREDSLVDALSALIHGDDDDEARQSQVMTMQGIDFDDILDPVETDQIRVRLLDPTDDGAPTQWTFNKGDTITVGREPSNTVVIMNPRVSRKHAEISFDGAVWQYANRGSGGSLKEGNKTEGFNIAQDDIVQLAIAGPRLQFDLPD